MALRRAAILLAASLAATIPAFAQAPSPDSNAAPPPQLPEKPPGPFKPEAPPATPDTWIFSGNLQNSKESFSGTLVSGKDDTQFELKLGLGATCDGSKLKGEVGLVRLPEIKCTDDRTMRALFVPQGGTSLKVFGHVGEDRFATEAHLLGTDPPPEPKPNAAPHGPLGLPPLPPGAAPEAPSGPGGSQPR